MPTLLRSHLRRRTRRRRSVIAGAAHRTPVLTSRTARRTHRRLAVLQVRKFPAHGRLQVPRRLQRDLAFRRPPAPSRRADVLVGQSRAGDRAVGTLAGIHATIVMPHDAPAAKIASDAGYGGEVITYDRYTENREELGRKLAEERGMTLIPPYDHPHVIAGQGTAAKELIEETGPLDYLFVCLGGGGLIGGCALAAAALSPACTVIGVEPEAGNDAQQSLARGEIVHIDAPRTIADGAASTHRRRIQLSDHPAACRADRDRQRRPAHRDDAVFCAAHEDGRRADRLPRGRSRAQQLRAGERQARRGGGERRQRRSARVSRNSSRRARACRGDQRKPTFTIRSR